MSKHSNETSKNAVLAKEAYETKVGLEALHRAGKCPQLKGHVHEIMFKDGYNANPMNILQGKHAMLTKSNTAQMKDVVMMQGKKVAGHAQLKDTVSSAGIRKTVEQIKSGHYSKTAVVGTKETAAKVGGEVSQKVHSSGISSETTTRIANKALGKVPTASALHMAGKSGGVAGAAIGAGVEAISSVKDVWDGNKTVGEAAGDVTVAAIKGGVTGYASSASGALAAGATSAALASTGIATAVGAGTVGAAAIVAAPAVVGLGVACAVGSFFSSLFD